MQIACSSCPAKYAVPDDKVRGKRARITCKHCGASIIIDGTGLGAEPTDDRVSSSARSRSTDAKRETPPSSARSTEGPWVVALGAGRQESASIPRIVELYRTRAINDKTYLWREGMSDWKTPFEIPQIEAALRAGGFVPTIVPPEEEATQIVPAPSEATANHVRGYEDESVTLALSPSRLRNGRPLGRPDSSPNAASPRTRAVTKLGIGGVPEQAPPTLRASAPPPPNRTGEHASARPLPELHHQGLSVSPGAAAARAARRPYARGATGSVDLFAERHPSVAPAPNTPPPPVEAEEPWTDPTLAPRMTGARNESSVLFSLDGLKPDREAERRRPSLNANELLYGPPPPAPPFHSQPPAAYGSSALSAPDFSAPAPRYQTPPPPQRHPAPARNATTVPPQGNSPYRPRQNGQPPRGVTPYPPQQQRPMSPPIAQPRPDFSYAAVANDDFGFRPPRRRGRYILIGLLLVGAIAGGVFALTMPDQPTLNPDPPVLATTPAPAPTPTPTPAPSPEPVAAEAAAPSAAPAAPPPSRPQRSYSSSSRSTPSWRSQREAEEDRDEPTREEEEAPAAQETAAPAEEQTPAPEVPNKPLTLAEAIAQSEGVKLPAKSGPAAPSTNTSETGDSASSTSSEGAEFDKGAALTALSTAADAAQNCKKLGGPTGTGQATVTFAPSGRVTMTSVDGDFAGSSVGSCIARLFRTARVPAFAGGPVTVKKRFSVE